jgi:Flp pilus assembly protein TadD
MNMKMMKRLISILILCLGFCAFCDGKEQNASSQFDDAYKALMAADDARDTNKNGEAIKLYKKALELYMSLAQTYPSLQPGVVKFRITYCNNQIESLMQRTDDKHASEPSSGAVDQSDESGRVKQANGKPTSGSSDKDTHAADVEQIKSTAKGLLLSGESEQARALLMEGVHLDPDNKTMRLMIGLAQCQGGLFTDAVYLLAELVREDPTNAQAHLALGTACFGLGRFDDAAASLKRATELDPNLAEAHYDLAQVLRMTKPPNMAGAREQYQKALKLGLKRDKELDSILVEQRSAKATGGKTAPQN